MTKIKAGGSMHDSKLQNQQISIAQNDQSKFIIEMNGDGPTSKFFLPNKSTESLRPVRSVRPRKNFKPKLFKTSQAQVLIRTAAVKSEY